MKTHAMIELSWELHPDRGPITAQLSDQIRTYIQTGQLAEGDRIPPTRTLAKELGIARGTVTTAIELLIAEGLLETRTGSGTFVSADAIGTPSTETKRARSGKISLKTPLRPDVDQPMTCAVDLRPCRPSLEAFPLNVWRRYMSQAASAKPSSDYGDARGDHDLRQSIADYLRRARGLTVEPTCVIITNGAIHAMHLLASLVLNKGDTVVFENPGYPLARQVFTACGGDIYSCPVDQDGLIIENLPPSSKATKIVYLTPSHQFPIGSRLSLGRRRRLIDWAHDRGCLIIEDDYDGEFRYDVPPLAPMATMDPDQVVYCGTFSKTMFPGLRIGFAVASENIIEAMAVKRAVSEYTANAPLQRALSYFISSGEYERHILRMRRIYAKKRQLVSEHLEGAAQLTGLQSGLSALIELDPKHSAQAISERLSHEGIIIPPLDRYDVRKQTAVNALVCGYAEPSLKQLSFAMQRLVHAVSSK